MLKVELQYFNGCPNSQELLDRVRSAIKQTSIEIEYSETLVETPQAADKIKFRGSPTLLIEGKDFENLPEPERGTLSCRYYSKGLPETEQIIRALQIKGDK